MKKKCNLNTIKKLKFIFLIIIACSIGIWSVTYACYKEKLLNKSEITCEESIPDREDLNKKVDCTSEEEVNKESKTDIQLEEVVDDTVIEVTINESNLKTAEMTTYSKSNKSNNETATSAVSTTAETVSKPDTSSYAAINTQNSVESEDNIIIVETDESTSDIAEEIAEEIIIKPYTDEEVEILTNLLYGEARGVADKAHQAAVIWTVLNRVDDGRFGKTITEVALAPNQFVGYVKNRTYGSDTAKKYYNLCKEIVIDVLDRYFTEDQVGRVLPKEYLYFSANSKGTDNVFRTSNGTVWNWGLESPYK